MFCSLDIEQASYKLIVIQTVSWLCSNWSLANDCHFIQENLKLLYGLWTPRWSVPLLSPTTSPSLTVPQQHWPCYLHRHLVCQGISLPCFPCTICSSSSLTVLSLTSFKSWQKRHPLRKPFSLSYLKELSSTSFADTSLLHMVQICIPLCLFPLTRPWRHMHCAFAHLPGT